MALLTGWTGKDGYSGPDNKQEHQLPATRELFTLVNVAGVYVWHKEQIDTERFSFVGMTKAAAEACQAAMVTQYTKSKQIPTISEGSIVLTWIIQCVADIKAVRTSGHMWQVDVDVNEVTHTFTLTAS